MSCRPLQIIAAVILLSACSAGKAPPRPDAATTGPGDGRDAGHSPPSMLPDSAVSHDAAEPDARPAFDAGTVPPVTDAAEPTEPGKEPSKDSGLPSPSLTWQMYDGLWSPADDWLGQDVSSVNSPISTSSWKVGGYTVTWNAGKSQLVIRAGSAGRVAWESRPGKAFLLAGRGKEDVKQWRGSFTISDKKGSELCREQRILNARQDSQGLLLSGTLSGPNCEVGFELRFEAAASRRLRFEAHITSAGKTDPAVINRIFLVQASGADERFYGFGEQFTYFDLKGRAVPILSAEQGHTRGRQPYAWALNQISPGAAGSWATTYAAVPQYISSRQRGFFLEDYELSVFNLEDENEVEVRLWKNHMAGQIFAGESYLDLIEIYTEFAGRMPMVPDWFHSGAIIGLMGGSDVVHDMHRRLMASDAPVAAYWIQDWVGKRVTDLGIRMWWNWDLDRSVYPDWDAMVKEFAAKGISVLGYLNPFLSDASSNPNHKRNLFKEAQALGYLTTWQDGKPAEIDSGGFTGTLVDLSNPKARRWLEDVIIEQLIGNGMRGWMADFGEALPFDAKLSQGQSAASVHNQYPELWAEVNRNAIRRAGLEGDTVAFLRCGFTRSPGLVPMFWLGDQMVTWDEDDGLKSSIVGLLSGGMSGFSLNHSDIGGLIALSRETLGIKIVDFVRTKEVFMRWAEMNAFTAVYRTHEGNNPDISHQFYSDAETMAHFVYFAKVFQALAPYRKELFREATERGYPVNRHMMLHYPADPRAVTTNYQFMLGSEVLVAPVSEPDKREWSVYLPRGRWVHLWSGATYGSTTKGSDVTVTAELGQPPVFFRADSEAGKRMKDAISALGKWQDYVR